MFEQDYIATIERWRALREESLRKPDGWLAVSGLYWLRDGDNAAGTAPDSDILLPEGSAPDRVGVFRLADGAIAFTADPDATVTWEGARVTTLLVKTDHDGEPDRLCVNALQMMVIRRGARAGIRLWDANSAARRDFKGLDWYPVNAAYRVTARYVPFASPRTITIDTILEGFTEQATAPGMVEFELNGTPCRLLAELRADGRTFFFNFRDATSGKTTYGNSRFLVADAPADVRQAGNVQIDFNKAFTPPCGFTPYATCPLPPRENRLNVAVEAGERFAGH